MIKPDDTDTCMYFSSTPVSTDSFSSYAEYPITVDGAVYPTVEHYIHAAKFIDPSFRQLVGSSETFDELRMLSKCIIFPVYSDWYKSRSLKAAYTAMYAKFTQYPELQEQLLQTGNLLLINCAVDVFWGRGSKLNGRNNMGLVLMQVRQQLLAEQSAIS